MTTNPNNNYPPKDDKQLPAADMGNASNPTPHNDNREPSGNNQLLDEKAEKYLREAGNIEDMPDPQEEEAEQAEEENSQ